MVKTLSVKEALNKENTIIIDTRTPKEYELDHLPKSVNIPIFSNEERALVGTIYKQVSQDKAIKQGVEFFSKNLPEMIDKIDQHKGKKLIIQCWRGGMRSRALAALLESMNYDIYQLEGGYKAYRAFIRQQLANYVIKPKLVVLHGLTGTGKTELLLQFENRIDLEGLARHRGSLYGGIGLKPNNQKNFENLLWQRLEKLKDKKYIFVEGESKRIGNIIIPEFFYKAMNAGIKIEINRTINNRAAAIIKEYFDTQEKIEKIKQITLQLKRNISGKRKAEVNDLIDQKKYQEAVKILLSDYYDSLYKHTLKDKKYDFSVNNDNIESAKKELEKKLKEINKKS